MNKIILQAKNITKRFISPNGEPLDILRGVNLEILQGQSVSLRGESGAGKTTLLNIISCLESNSGGEIFWDDKRVDNISNSKQAKLRGSFMSFVFQNYCLVPELNALENVELAARIAGKFDSAAKKRARELLSSVGLQARMRHLPSQLSGGEKQRVAIARAIMNNPRIILADEPTGNLDESTGLEVMEIFLDLCAKHSTSLLLITHNPEFASRTNRQVKLSSGIVSPL